MAIALVGSQRRLPPPFGLAAPGVVAFVADGDLWTANPDGSDRVRLTTDPRIDGFPVFSRDGTRIAFKRLPVENARPDWEDWGDVVVADVDGSHPIVLDPDVHSPSPMSWSGDGRFLVYSRTVDGLDQVFIAATDGSMRRQITSGGQDNWGPTLSPDGRTIAFVKSNTGIFVIQTTAPASGRSRPVPSSNSSSPSGRRTDQRCCTPPAAVVTARTCGPLGSTANHRTNSSPLLTTSTARPGHPTANGSPT